MNRVEGETSDHAVRVRDTSNPAPDFLRQQHADHSQTRLSGLRRPGLVSQRTSSGFQPSGRRHRLILPAGT